LHVTSAGNLGITYNHKNAPSYFTLNKQLKNALVVGNWDGIAWQPGIESSRGPTRDGRIKPDVMAPGQTIRSTWFCSEEDKDARPGRDQCKQSPVPLYELDSGTSQAAAATTGALALVLEQYKITYGVNLDERPPLPSTLRALMIHTASNRPGRDPES